MAHHDTANHPQREFLMSLIGVALFVLLAGGIAVSAYLRPAGEHQPQPKDDMATDKNTATLVNADSTGVAPAQAKNAGIDNQTDPVVSTKADSPSSALKEQNPSITPPPDASAGKPATPPDSPATSSTQTSVGQ